MAKLSLKNVSKTFSETEVISGASLDITDGEFAVFVGPSGSGKSTLLRIIAGLEEIDDGEILIDGVDVAGIAPAQRGIAMVFQSYALYPHMTVYENLAFGLKIAGASRDEIELAVKSAAETLGLVDLLDRRPRELSGGERQRTAIGRAIVRKPRIFLFDEPLSNLDAALRLKMRHEFARLHDELNTTMIYVTHDQAEAMTLADRIVVLRNGRVEQSGPPQDLYERPANRFVAGFIGSPAMNFFDGTISEANSAGMLVQLKGGTKLQIAAMCDGIAIGANVAIGIRPEHLAIGREAKPNMVDAVVDLTEQLGSRTLIYVRTPHAANLSVIEAPGNFPVRSGEAVQIYLPPDKCHVFDVDGFALPRCPAP